VDILPDYQNGQVLLSNYGKTQIDHVMTLQPYETLAILVGKN